MGLEADGDELASSDQRGGDAIGAVDEDAGLLTCQALGGDALILHQDVEDPVPGIAAPVGADQVQIAGTGHRQPVREPAARIRIAPGTALEGAGRGPFTLEATLLLGGGIADEGCRNRRG